MSSRREIAADRGLRRGHRRGDPGPGPRISSTRKPPNTTHKRRELGVEDGVLEVEGVTLPIAVALGEGEVKTVEDLAGLVPDDLRGYYESKDGERVREPGILDDFNLSPEDAEAPDHAARVAVGWIEPEAGARTGRRDRRSRARRTGRWSRLGCVCEMNLSACVGVVCTWRDLSVSGVHSLGRGETDREAKLIRFWRVDGAVRETWRGAGPGGAWAEASRAAVETAARRNAFARAAKDRSFSLWLWQ